MKKLFLILTVLSIFVVGVTLGGVLAQPQGASAAPAAPVVVEQPLTAIASQQDEAMTGTVEMELRPLRFVVVSHGQASDPFWSVVKNGVDAAAEDMRVTVEYQAPGTFDMVAMAQLIDAAVASEPDGLVVSIPDADALGDSITAAIDAGIPVISMNSGSDVAEELGILTHVGQTEYEAGYGGGERMAEAGATTALCINQEVGNAALDLRCQGFTDAMTEAGGTVEVLAVDLADPTDAQQKIVAALTANPDIDSILTLGPTGAAPALAALEDEGMLGDILLATFDLSPEVLEAVRDGNMLFAIDQQQYLQGYLPIVLLTLYKENLNTVGSKVLLTGPGFVTQDNAAQVIDLSAAGTR
ncbi:MAG: sugar ABC transporter substrate-binding protein [Chloroflexi bacterium]|nr:sugar ABC transporter substrate-binding protein [Chloroflexota bacterium]